MLQSRMLANAIDVVIDLGASQYRIGSAEHDCASPRIVGRTPGDVQAIVSALSHGVKEISGHYHRPIKKVSVGCPGLITDSGAVLKSLHVPLSGVDLQSVLIERLGVDVRVVNDAKAQAIGCAEVGQTLLYMVLGTGVGGAFIDRGRIVSGAENFAGEVGHIPVCGVGRTCPCGATDCLDTYASGWALSKQLGQRWYERDLNPDELEVIRSAGKHLGMAARLCAILLNPRLVAVAGHIVGNATLRTGFLEEWPRKGWVTCDVRFIDDTWPLASRGLANYT